LKIIRATGLVEIISPRGFVQIIAAEARALGSGGNPLATFEPTGTRLLSSITPVPRCLSLLARRRLRRAPAPDGTRLDPESARWPAGISTPPRRERAARARLTSLGGARGRRALRARAAS